MPHVTFEDTIPPEGKRFRFKFNPILVLPQAIDFNICNVPNFGCYSREHKMYVIPIDTFISIGLKRTR